MRADGQRQLLEAYLKATESPEPDVWKRKLHILENFADDDHMRQWAQAELKYIQEFAGLDALYRETLKVASQLVEPHRLASPERAQARVRSNPALLGQSAVRGRKPGGRQRDDCIPAQLLIAESQPAGARAWDDLDGRLINLSTALRDSTPAYPQPTPPGGRPEGSR